MNEAERNVAEESSQWLDAAHAHGHKNDENEEPCHRRGDVVPDVCPERVVACLCEVVHGKGSQVSHKVDDCPEDNATTNNDVKDDWALQWE